jgi:hypothetical protein
MAEGVNDNDVSMAAGLPYRELENAATQSRFHGRAIDFIDKSLP